LLGEQKKLKGVNYKAFVHHAVGIISKSTARNGSETGEVQSSSFSQLNLFNPWTIVTLSWIIRALLFLTISSTEHSGCLLTTTNLKDLLSDQYKTKSPVTKNTLCGNGPGILNYLCQREKRKMWCKNRIG